ncbi:3982_t:CDS:2 [Entrophospora sp. SA101]|nr:12133_t:CDS:2 [Entrophospora sp. SA101]CAJ0848352.1 3982_t:CDS:2 [Entrophospora sp. SA101]
MPTESSPATICHSLPLPNQISSLSTTTDPESPANYIINQKKSFTSKFKKPQKNQSLPNIQTSVNSPNTITKNDYSSIAPRAAKPLSPTTMTSNNTTFSTKVIHDLLVSSALNVENASKSTHDSSLSSSLSSTSNPPPLNLQTTTVNFRKFVQKCGFIFDIQDSVENLITWKNPANTLLAMVVYINVCLYPQLLIILPLVGLLITSIYFYQKKFPQGPPPLQNKSIKSKKSKTKKFKKLKYPNLISPAAENSVDYLKNMQNIQNLMGMISDGYDSVLPLIKYIDWSDEALTLRITRVVIIGLMVLSLVAWVIPWSYVFIIGGVNDSKLKQKNSSYDDNEFILEKN